MKCPNCEASSNSFGVYMGKASVHCLKCGVYFNGRTGELYMDKVKKPTSEQLDNLIELIRRKND